jgi:thiol-disulfide isomerase/thioredoxin
MFETVGVALLAIVLVLVIWKLRTPLGVEEQPVPAGTSIPALKVAGWLNVPEGEAFHPSGKIVVMDLWATYCPPCRSEIPHLAKLAEHYRPLGVEFVGLTDEEQQDLPTIKTFIEQTPGFNWPVGYGAMQVLNDLNIRGIPTLIVFGPDGKARRSWVGEGPQGVEETLDALLAAPK